MDEEEDDDTPRLSAHTLATLQEFLAAGGGDLSFRQEIGRGEEEKEKVLSIVPEDWRLEEEEDDDDMPRLSSLTLATLQEFVASRGGELSFRQAVETGEEEKEKVLSIVPEDWHLSQFWYDPHTAHTVAEELFVLSMQLQSPIACISCPSLYVELKKTFSAEACLFEYDQRFQRYGSDFTFYDYNFPENLPEKHQHAFQVVVADPPYLSKECIEKTANTMKLMAKDGHSRFLLLTGAVQEEHARDLLGAHPCVFRPSHDNKLGNEFWLYTNYDPLERLGGWMKQ